MSRAVVDKYQTNIKSEQNERPTLWNKATIANYIRLCAADPRQGQREGDEVQFSWGYVQ